jgi:hypothetical protein
MEDEMGRACREMRNAYKILAGKPNGKSLEDLCVDGRIILKWISGN